VCDVEKLWTGLCIVVLSFIYMHQHMKILLKILVNIMSNDEKNGVEK